MSGGLFGERKALVVVGTKSWHLESTSWELEEDDTLASAFISTSGC